MNDDFPLFPRTKDFIVMSIVFCLAGVTLAYVAITFFPPPVQLEPFWVFATYLAVGCAFFGDIMFAVTWMLFASRKAFEAQG